MIELKKDLKLFNDLAEILLEEEKKHPVANRIETDTLYDELDLSLNQEGMLDTEFKQTLQKILIATPKTATNLFFNQLFGGRQSKAVLGDLLAVLLNNSMYTYKVAGPQVGVEKEIINQSNKLIGYGENADGTLPSGGSMSNYMALIMARDDHDPTVKSEGVKVKMTLYVSEESHYSHAKNASFSGIGQNNIRYIPADKFGRMIPEELDKQMNIDIQQGLVPTFVCATAGTTVLGAFDPIDQIADVCEKYNAWLHVDGAYMGSVMFSERYDSLIKGADRSDSFSYNAHKMLGTPLTCSILLVKNKEYLHQSFSQHADYLYQTDDDDFNLGKTSLQCGRRNDALKFWTLWKSVGTKGLEKIVDQQFDLANIACDYINNHPDYELYSYDDSISVCFNYKDIEPGMLCQALYQNQEVLVGSGSFDGREFVRLVTINANNEKADILNFFNTIEAYVTTSVETVQAT